MRIIRRCKGCGKVNWIGVYCKACAYAIALTSITNPELKPKIKEILEKMVDGKREVPE